MRRTSVRRLLGLVTFQAATLVAAEAHADTWTVLGYVSADNNLEAAAIDNVNQMVKVGSTGNLKVAIQVDRSLKYSQKTLPGVANFAGTKRFRVDPNTLVEVQDVGHPDGTQPLAIADFISWGIHTYPADHYAVFFWDHGGGWQGCCEAETSPGRDWTPLSDLAEGVHQGVVNGGITKLDLIGFDECLMANVEVAYALQPWAKILVGSEETEPSEGWDYEPFLRSITQNAAIDAPTVGKAIADGYHAFVASDESHTMSVVDLTRLPALTTAIDGLADVLGPAAGVRESWKPIAQARQGSETYASDGVDDPLSVVDLGDFTTGAAGTAAFKTQADAVNAALTAAVLYKVQGAGHAKSTGLSIHLPQRGAKPGYAGVSYAQQTHWPTFLAQYAVGAGSDVTPPDVNPPTIDTSDAGTASSDAGSGGGIPTIFGPIDLSSLSTADDLGAANLLLSNQQPDGSITFLGALPALLDPSSGKMHSTFDGKWPTLSDGVNEGVAPFFSVGSFTNKGGAPAERLAFVADLSDAGGYKPGVVVFDYDTKTRSAPVAKAYTFDLLKGFGPVNLQTPGTKVRPWNLTVQSFGLPTTGPGTKEYDGTALGIKAKALPKSQYNVGFLVSDLAGNVATTQTPVNVDVQDVTDVDGGTPDGGAATDATNIATSGCGGSSGSGCGTTNAPVSDAAVFFSVLAGLAIIRGKKKKKGS